MVRAAALSKKKKEKDGASSSPSKGVTKGVPKRKSDGKDDRLLKKGMSITIGDGKEKKPPSLPKPTHGASKVLMTKTNPVGEGTHHLRMHKGYAVEMVKLIIKEMGVEPCAEQETEDLGASGLFDLSRVCFSQTFLPLCLFVGLQL